MTGSAGGGVCTTTGWKATRLLGSTTHPASNPKPPTTAAAIHNCKWFVLMA
jgi:hypothetical protein